MVTDEMVGAARAEYVRWSTGYDSRAPDGFQHPVLRLGDDDQYHEVAAFPSRVMADAELRERSMRAAIEAYEAASWRDISTAPKDGTDCLVGYQINHGEDAGRFYWTRAHWEPHAQWGPSWHDGFFSIKPTHWRLIKPPLTSSTAEPITPA